MQEILKTDRLVLRHFNPDDAPRVHALANNWNIARMMGRLPYPYSRSEAAAWIATHDGLRAAGREFPLAVELEGTLIGATGVLIHGNGDHELGYWIGEPYWNRGFATEAGRGAIDYAVRRLGAGGVIAGHFVENHASGRVLTKLGFRYTAEESRWCEARQTDVRSLAMRLQDRTVFKAAPRTTTALRAAMESGR